MVLSWLESKVELGRPKSKVEQSGLALKVQPTLVETTVETSCLRQRLRWGVTCRMSKVNTSWTAWKVKRGWHMSKVKMDHKETKVETGHPGLKVQANNLSWRSR